MTRPITAACGVCAIVMANLTGCAADSASAVAATATENETPATAHAHVQPIEHTPHDGLSWSYYGPYLSAFNVLGSARHAAFNVGPETCRRYLLGPEQEAFAFYSSGADTSVVLIYQVTRWDRAIGYLRASTRERTLAAYLLRDYAVREQTTPDFALWQEFLELPRDQRRQFSNAVPLDGAIAMSFDDVRIAALDMQLYTREPVPKFTAWLDYHQQLYETKLNDDLALLRPKDPVHMQNAVVTRIHIWREQLDDIRAQRRIDFAGPAAIEGRIAGTWAPMR